MLSIKHRNPLWPAKARAGAVDFLPTVFAAGLGAVAVDAGGVVQRLRVLKGSHRTYAALTKHARGLIDMQETCLVLYRRPTKRDHKLYEVQVRELASRAQQQALQDKNGIGARAGAHHRVLPLNQLGCIVGVHYSWACLQRLAEARAAGRQVLVDSVVVPTTAPQHLLELALGVAPVYCVDPVTFAAEFQREGGNDPASASKTCSYAVTFPVQRPLAQLRPPMVILDGLVAAQNVGQILRTALHLGVTSVIASQGAWNNLTGRAARVSMGWIYHMDFHLAEPLTAALHQLQAAGICIYAAENNFAKPVAPHEPNGDRLWALVVGSEDSGISQEVVAMSDAKVKVPQRGGESLNVAHATAICLYELGRNMRT